MNNQINKIKNKSYDKINQFVEWLIFMVGYAMILLFLSLVFKQTIYIDNSYFGIWGLLAAIIIYLLNKTIKPLIFLLTLPITGLTLGLFYPVINIIILKITALILGNHFNIKGIFMSFLIAILISLLHIIVEDMILKPVLRRK